MDETLHADLAKTLPALYAVCSALTQSNQALDLCRRAVASAASARRTGSETLETIACREAIEAWKEMRRAAPKPIPRKSKSSDLATPVTLMNAFDALTPDDQAVLVLKDVLGRSSADMAAILNMSLTSLKSRVAKAREELRVARHRVEGRLI